MQKLITAPDGDPLGAMMQAYLAGDTEAFLEVESTTLEMSTMTGKMMFRDFQEMDEIEKRALSLCRGKVLDLGAGSGSHSLYLQQQGLTVDAVDISPGAVEVMRKRGVTSIYHSDFYSIKNGDYQTLLLLMNGLGLSGSLKGLSDMLSHGAELLAADGQILADSTDLTRLYGEVAEEYRFEEAAYFGETEFVMRYGDIVSEPFPWLYVDFAALQTVAEDCGFVCEQLLILEGDRYLVRLLRK